MEEKLIKIQSIFRDVIDDDSLEITPDTTRADIPDWDSVAMVQIILAIESEFSVKFTTAEVANLKSVSDILKKIV